MKRFGFFMLFVSWLLLAGCVTAPLRETPTLTPDAVRETIAALQADNAQLATQVAGLPATIENLPAATPLPSATPTATLTPAATPTATATRAVVRRPAATATPAWPQILSFTSDQGEVNPGESVSLHWDTGNATRLKITQYAEADVAYDEINVAPSGSIVLPTSDRERLWHDFTLFAYNAAGDSTSSSVHINIRCPYTYFFFMSAEEYRYDCPEGPMAISNAAEQYFENGRMIWIENEQRIYALLNDGGLLAYADTWVAGQPDSDPSITPPAGRYKPVRGFGKVWSADPYIRSRLGWAMGPEKGFQAQLQRTWTCCVVPHAQFYLRELDNRITRFWLGQSPSGDWAFTRY